MCVLFGDTRAKSMVDGCPSLHFFSWVWLGAYTSRRLMVYCCLRRFNGIFSLTGRFVLVLPPTNSLQRIGRRSHVKQGSKKAYLGMDLSWQHPLATFPPQAPNSKGRASHPIYRLQVPLQVRQTCRALPPPPARRTPRLERSFR